MPRSSLRVKGVGFVVSSFGGSSVCVLGRSKTGISGARVRMGGRTVDCISGFSEHSINYRRNGIVNGMLRGGDGVKGGEMAQKG